MLRKLVLVGVVAGASVSLPILYQSNPQAFEQTVRAAVQGNEAKTRKVSAPIAANSVKPVETVETLVGRKVRLSADPNGHFLADFKLNGRSISAMVDTGATLVAINRSTARRIGINLNPADFRYQVATANGNTKAAGVIIDNLQIGRIAVGKVQAVVLEDDALSGTLIGMSFLKQLSKFQVENGSLLLVQ
jgi:aspartyl protease family protein